MKISRRNALKLFGATAISATAVQTIAGTGTAEAAYVKLGDAYIAKLWGTKRIRRRIVGTSRFEYVRVPAKKSIYRGTSNRVLNRGLGMWPDSAPIGSDTGHVIIFGHRTSAGGPMRNSHKLVAGDIIDIAGYTYEVEKWEVVLARPAMNALTYPADLPGASGGRLSIITCTRPNGLPTGTRHRLVVRAKKVSNPVV